MACVSECCADDAMLPERATERPVVDPLAGLMQAAQQGDARAYDRLLRAILPELRRFARRRLSSAAEAEDAVQDTLLAVHTLRHTFDPARPFRPWLLAIARRRVIDRLRRAEPRRRREVVLDDTLAHEAALETRAEGERAVLATELRQAIAALPQVQRAALTMAKLHDAPLSDIAAATGRSVAALKVATHRGIAALRRRMGERAVAS
jgi:RNA polymerase sigma-70 factor (ECF subfamily)